jgi:DNA-binding response OmpR family regulator
MNRPANLASLEGKRVLLVEDEPLEAMDYCDRLAEAGAEVIGPCLSVADAMRCIAAGKIDVAVLDFALGERNTFVVQDELERKRIPFIVLTGHPHLMVRRSAEQKILSKPVSSELLCRIVGSVPPPAAASCP